MNTICRGLVGHVSYMATCSLSTVYSETLLYEPIARIAQSKGYNVRCEMPVGLKPPGPGDNKRIDFQITKGDRSTSLEVKWCKRKPCDVTKDVRKLMAMDSNDRFLLVFGPGKIVDGLTLKSNGELFLAPAGKLVRWNSGMTDYAAQWYRV